MSETRRRRILLIDDDPSVHLALKHVLKAHYDCLSAHDGGEARIVLAGARFDAIILDLNITFENEGLQLLPEIRQLDPDADVIISSANTDRGLVKSAISNGAAAWLVKEYSAEQLLFTLESVFMRRALIKESEHHRADRGRRLSRVPLIGESQAMKGLKNTLDKVRQSRANVLIQGETGTGKELVARHISMVEGRPFVAVDSSTITSTMAESMLFGHEKGAFTGAVASSKGLFEEADGGTIYFDEIGNMPLEIQTKLLRVMQEKEITRVGSRRVIQLDFRVVCATNLDLETMAKSGAFKYDLLQRINVIPIAIPSLKQRKEDIPALVAHFLAIHTVDAKPSALSPEAHAALQTYDWPGNVRELSNVMAYLCTMAGDREQIELEDLPEKLCNPYRANLGVPTPEVSPPYTDVSTLVQCIKSGGETDFYGFLKQIEGRLLAALYAECGDNLSQLSKSIKVSRSHLYAKLNEHGILK